ncbi:MAG: hypothetical protein LRY51_03125 [Geovibrio sp.]|nr:hypothetical protein [Geovibrio sp.]
MIDILNDENIVFSILFTARTCLAVLVLHCAAGLMLGYYLGKRKGIFAGFVDFLVTLPLVFPPVGTGFILLYLLGRNGLIASLTGAPSHHDIIFTEKG